MATILCRACGNTRCCFREQASPYGLMPLNQLPRETNHAVIDATKPILLFLGFLPV